jgi:hypothetical protein
MPKDDEGIAAADDEALAHAHAKLQAERGYVEFEYLRRAVEIVEGVTPLSPVERERLVREINGALWDYVMAKQPPTFHRFARRFAIVYEELARGPNTLAILAMLGAPIGFPLTGQDQQTVDRATAQHLKAAGRYTNLMHELKTIAEKMPTPPAKQRVGKKANVYLYRLVRRLADCWKAFTGKKFTVLWHKENGEWKPVSAAVRFVHTVTVFRVIDPTQVKLLKTVVENTATKRNKSASRKRR